MHPQGKGMKDGTRPLASLWQRPSRRRSIPDLRKSRRHVGVLGSVDGAKAPWALGEAPWALGEAPWALTEAPWALTEGPWALIEGPWALTEGPWALTEGPWAPWGWLPSLASLGATPLKQPWLVSMPWL